LHTQSEKPLYCTRAISSVGSEHLVYTQRVGGSNPSSPTNSCIPRWLKKYGKFTYEYKTTIGRPMKDPQQQRIKELEAQLAKKEEELKVFKRFIEIAERELKIDIVKKSGSKQSQK
jgi:hypothetical protein